MCKLAEHGDLGEIRTEIFKDVTGDPMPILVHRLIAELFTNRKRLYPHDTAEEKGAGYPESRQSSHESQGGEQAIRRPPRSLADNRKVIRRSKPQVLTNGIVEAGQIGPTAELQITNAGEFGLRSIFPGRGLPCAQGTAWRQLRGKQEIARLQPDRHGRERKSPVHRADAATQDDLAPAEIRFPDMGIGASGGGGTGSSEALGEEPIRLGKTASPRRLTPSATSAAGCGSLKPACTWDAKGN